MNLGAPIAVGNTAEIYLCDNKIIKVFKDFLPPTESLYEANKQKYVYSCGLPVPKILNVTEIAGKQAIIMEYVEGKTIGDLLLKNMERTEYFINISVEIQQNIHAHVADSLEPMSEQLIRKIQASSFLDNKHKSLLTKKLNGIKYEERLCHGDYHLFNLIQAIHDVVIIDWVDSSAGDICADVCHTYLLYSQFSEKLAEMYLQIYCKKSGLLKDEIMQWAPIIAGAKLSENMPSENVKRFLEIVHSDCPH